MYLAKILLLSSSLEVNDCPGAYAHYTKLWEKTSDPRKSSVIGKTEVQKITLDTAEHQSVFLSSHSLSCPCLSLLTLFLHCSSSIQGQKDLYAHPCLTHYKTTQRQPDTKDSFHPVIGFCSSRVMEWVWQAALHELCCGQTEGGVLGAGLSGKQRVHKSMGCIPQLSI